MKNLIFIIFTLILVSSCTVQKRLHNRGVHVVWHKTYKNKGVESNNKNFEENKISSVKQTEQNQVEEITSNIISTVNEDNGIIASNEEFLPLTQQSKRPLISNPNVECDLIILRNGKEILGKVIEVNNEDIKYRSCDNLDGPIYSIYVDVVLMIRYVNGKKDVFDQEQEPVRSNYNTAPSKNKTKITETKKAEPLSYIGLGFALGSWFIMFFASLLVGVILFGIGMLLSSAGLGRVMNPNNPQFKTPGNWLSAILGVIIALVGLIIGILFIVAILG